MPCHRCLFRWEMNPQVPLCLDTRPQPPTFCLSPGASEPATLACSSNVGSTASYKTKWSLKGQGTFVGQPHNVRLGQSNSHCPRVISKCISFHSQSPSLSSKLYGYPEPLPALDLPGSTHKFNTQSLRWRIPWSLYSFPSWRCQTSRGVHSTKKAFQQPAEPRGGFLEAVAVASLGGSATLNAREGWGGVAWTTLGAGRDKEKREQRREFNNNPTSGYHFSCLKSQGELRLPYFQWRLGKKRKWQPWWWDKSSKVINLYLLSLL